MSCTVRWQRVGPEHRLEGAASGFVDNLDHVFGLRPPCMLSAGHLLELRHLAEQYKWFEKNPYTDIADVIEKFGAVWITAEW